MDSRCAAGHQLQPSLCERGRGGPSRRGARPGPSAPLRRRHGPGASLARPGRADLVRLGAGRGSGAGHVAVGRRRAVAGEGEGPLEAVCCSEGLPLSLE